MSVLFRSIARSYFVYHPGQIVGNHHTAPYHERTVHVGTRSLMLSGCGLYDLFRDRFDGLPFSSPSRTRLSAEAILDFSLERGVHAYQRALLQHQCRRRAVAAACSSGSSMTYSRSSRPSWDASFDAYHSNKSSIRHPAPLKISLPDAPHVDVKGAQHAIQIRIPVIAVTAIVEDHAALDLMRKEIVCLALADPLRYLHCRDLR